MLRMCRVTLRKASQNDAKRKLYERLSSNANIVQEDFTHQQSTNRAPYENSGQPAQNLRVPREARTARALDRLAQAEEAGMLSPEDRLNMMGDVNAARGFAARTEYPNSVARKVQVGFARPVLKAQTGILGSGSTCACRS